MLVQGNYVHQLATALRAGLQEDVRNVKRHGALGDAEFTGDGPGGKLAESQMSDLNFTGRQQLVQTITGFQKRVASAGSGQSISVGSKFVTAIMRRTVTSIRCFLSC